MNNYMDYERIIRKFVKNNREYFEEKGSYFAFGYFNGNGEGFDCEMGMIAVGDTLEDVDLRISESYKSENRFLDLSKPVLKGTLEEIISPPIDDDLGVFNLI